MSAPGQLSVYISQIEAALRGGDTPGALALADRACGEGIEHPHLLVMAAHHRLQGNDVARALSLSERASALAPQSPDARNIQGLSLIRAERRREAIAVFDAALAANPGTALLHFGKAQAHELLAEPERVRAELDAVIALQPNHHDALAWAANLATQRGDNVAARDYAGRALALHPGLHDARLTLAVADIAEGKFADAVSSLQSLLNDPALSRQNLAFAQSLMGDALDGQDKPDQAFAFYTDAKKTLLQYYAAKNMAAENAATRVARLAAYFKRADAAAWRAKPTGKPKRTHVFLLGFPRSGTTLLEQVLASHPDIETMEERDALLAAVQDFTRSDAALDRLAASSDAELEHYRQAYWDVATEFGHRIDAPVFVDKLPLNTVLLPVIARLFPGAKILFALRDPRDVVLSCFRRRFGMNPQMYELNTLQGAAAYYDAVMGLAEIYRPLLDQDLTETRHENLVADFEGETRRLCAFLGLEWREDMKNFARRAQDGVINTPSSAQVARGLNRAGMDQWRRYESKMAPMLPLLAPWVARFGYEGDA